MGVLKRGETLHAAMREYRMQYLRTCRGAAACAQSKPIP